MLSILGSQLGWLDHIYFLLKNKCFNKNEPLMFSKGWGSDEAIQSVVSRFQLIAECHTSPSSIELIWEKASIREDGLIEQYASFQTPLFLNYLPAEAHAVYLKLISPEEFNSTLPVVLHLPTTREEGFQGRDKTAIALARKGIACLMIEGAFLGKRRPLVQQTATLHHLSDFFLLCGSAIEESRSIMGWLQQFGTRKTLVAGVSKGGYIANAAGATMPTPVGIASIVPPHSGMDVFIDGITHKICDWDVMRQTAPPGTTFDLYLSELFELTSISKIKPSTMKPTIVLGASNDKYVPPSAYQSLKRAWCNIDLRWCYGGHVSTIIDRRHLLSAIFDGLDRLELRDTSSLK